MCSENIHKSSKMSLLFDIAIIFDLILCSRSSITDLAVAVKEINVDTFNNLFGGHSVIKNQTTKSETMQLTGFPELSSWSHSFLAVSTLSHQKPHVVSTVASQIPQNRNLFTSHQFSQFDGKYCKIGELDKKNTIIKTKIANLRKKAKLKKNKNKKFTVSAATINNKVTKARRHCRRGSLRKNRRNIFWRAHVVTDYTGPRVLDYRKRSLGNYSLQTSTTKPFNDEAVSENPTLLVLRYGCLLTIYTSIYMLHVYKL